MLPKQQYTLATRPADSPMNLDAGKPTPTEALLTTGVNLVFLLASALGGWIAYAFAPKRQYDEFTTWGYIGFGLGVLIGLYCLQQAYAYGSLTRKGWHSYYARLDEWHSATLDFYERAQGLETVSSVSVYDYDPNVPHHVLLTALAVHRRIALEGGAGRRAAFSVRALEGPLMLGDSGSRHLVKIGELKGTKPEKMSNMMAALGLIRDRRANYAGVWVPSDEAEVIELVAKNWHKIGPRTADRGSSDE